jgi:hypothetical protein
MNNTEQNTNTIKTLNDLARLADYSLMDTLNPDPEARENGVDHEPREVFSGHYVPVNPTPIENPQYIIHSKNFFAELGFADGLAETADFVRMFSGDISLSPRWKVGGSSGYDFKNQGFTLTQLRFERDLKSFNMRFNWSPFGRYERWYFFIGIKIVIKPLIVLKK